MARKAEAQPLEKHIRSCELLQRRSWAARLDVLPWAVVYIVLHVLLGLAPRYAKGARGWLKELLLCAIPCVLFLHVLLFFAQEWFAGMRKLVGYSTIPWSKPHIATHILVHPVSRSLSAKIIPLQQHNVRELWDVEALSSSALPRHHVLREEQLASVTVAAQRFEHHAITFEYQKIVYVFEDSPQSPRMLKYPTRSAIQDYMQWTGHSDETADVGARMWGRNFFDIPMPTFLELFREHMVAPFFIFQVFCLVLWSLDEYWYYSGVTLCMLILFESMLCSQRQNSLQMLRGMRRAAYPIFVYRDSMWIRKSTEDLLPGDVISIRTPRRIVSLGLGRRKAQNTEVGLSSRGKKKKSVPDKDLIAHDTPVNVPSPEEQFIPCDALLLHGSLVVNEAMLTGESVPQMKEASSYADDLSAVLEMNDGSNMVDAILRRHVVFGGTQVIQHTYENMSELMEGVKEKPKIAPPPDEGCPAVVLRTGFATTQGQLMRTILFASETVHGSGWQTAVFILILLVFAVVASAYVLIEGLKDEGRNRFKLVLHCIMIVTSVVPPELPMELSMAVTNSLAALSRQFIYCTEPFRIAFAGRVDVCCFDKTGTLTEDRLLFKSLVTVTNDCSYTHNEIFAPSSVILASCHSLVVVDGKFVGDPLEKAAIDCLAARMDGQDTIRLHEGGNAKTLRIKHRYPFSSSLKRMSVLVQEGADGPVLVCTKGAPEVIQQLLTEVPAHYEITYKQHMSEGKRVIALAYRQLPADMQASTLRGLTRADFEKNLTLAGLVTFDCELKLDSMSVMRDLHRSSHKTCMITGDGVLTAADVARQLQMVTRPATKTLVLSTRPGDAELVWMSLEQAEPLEREVLPFNLSAVSGLATEADLCVTGASLEQLIAARGPGNAVHRLSKLCPHVRVFARVSPEQKELILSAFGAAGCVTLMCGDGTNDVGALKQAHVGVSIVNNHELESKMRAMASTLAPNESQRDTSGARMQRTVYEMQEQDRNPLMVKLGDASIASPFTARRTSIECVLAVLRQGRCTLVTTLQVYKILALNCLVSAYMMSVLYVMGLKQGDTQMTCMGLVVAGFFFCLSRAKPLQELSSQRPPSSVFALSTMLSILGQFVVHLTCLRMATALCHSREGTDMLMTPDAEFRPNVVNTVIFLLSACMQVNTFVVNYRGRPFMEGLHENVALWRGAQLCYLVLLMAAMEWFQPLNAALELSRLPSTSFRYSLAALLVGNLFGVFAVEKVCVQLEMFHGKPARNESSRD